MRIRELAPVRGNSAYPVAKQIKPEWDWDDPSVVDKDGNPLSYPRDKFNNLVQALEKQGWRKLGSGVFAQVLEHPKFPYVIKMFANDPAYMRYFNWARQNQDNPHVPKIRGKFIKIANDVYAIRMEKLIQLPQYNDPMFVDYVSPELKHRTLGYIFDPKNYDYLKENYPKLYEVIAAINSMVKYTDIHSENVMMRKDGTLVITDPMA